MYNELAERRRPLVTVTTVHQQKMADVTELCDGEIARQRCLLSLFAYYSYATMGGLYHADVIAAVAF